jgi:hypothetical protein
MGISAGPITGGNRHCLIDVMDTSKFFPKWLERAEELPKRFVENVCSRVEGMGARPSELKEVVKFLDERRLALTGILNGHRNEFPLITDWPLIL